MMAEMLRLALLACSLAVLLFSCFKVAYSLWWKPKALERHLRQQGIRGNPYRFFYGDLKDDMHARIIASSKPMDLSHQFVPRVAPLLHQIVQKYGKISVVWIGTTPRVIIYDPELMTKVLLDRMQQFRKSRLNPLVKLLGMGVPTLDGEEWARRRRVINPAFHLEKLKEMAPAFLKSCVDMVERWQNLTSPEGSCEVDVWNEFQNLTADIISRTAFGSSYKEGKKIFELQKEQAVLVMEGARAPYFPGFRFVPTAKNKRRMHIHREIKSMLMDMINKKLDSIAKGESTADDLLGLLVQYSNDKDHGNCSITTDDVIEECKLFYFAGQETTSVLLTWTLILLSIYPTWQQRAREEVVSVCGKNSPDFESTSRLKTVTMILHEVLRLYPPATGILRRTIKTTKLGGFSFPAGIELFLPILLIHHDRETWGEDAEEFKPERFSEGVSKASRTPNARNERGRPVPLSWVSLLISADWGGSPCRLCWDSWVELGGIAPPVFASVLEESRVTSDADLSGCVAWVSTMEPASENSVPIWTTRKAENAWVIPSSSNALYVSSDVSLFSSSLPVLRHDKLNFRDSHVGIQSTVNAASKLKKLNNDMEGKDPLDDLDLQEIGVMLPDDEEALLSGIMDDFDLNGLPGQVDELEDYDLFGSVGGMELDSDPTESIAIGVAKSSVSDGSLGNGFNQYSLPNGVGTISGEHPYGEHPSRTLFVRNINSNVEDSELQLLFEQYGDIRSLYTACKHRGFVMISYYDIRSARSAMRALQNKPLRRRKLDIHFSIPKDNPSDKDMNQGTLVIFNLEHSVSNDDLKQIFGAYGEVKEIRETPHKRHHKFIEFYDVRAAEAALRSLNKSDIAGKRIKLEPSRPGGSRRSLMQQLTHELEQDETRVYRHHGGLSTANSPPGPWAQFSSPNDNNPLQIFSKSPSGAAMSPIGNNDMSGLSSLLSPKISSVKIAPIGKDQNRASHPDQISSSSSPFLGGGYQQSHSFPDHGHGVLTSTPGNLTSFGPSTPNASGVGSLTGPQFLWGNLTSYMDNVQSSSWQSRATGSSIMSNGQGQAHSFLYSSHHGSFLGSSHNQHPHHVGSAPSVPFVRQYGFFPESPKTSLMNQVPFRNIGINQNGGSLHINMTPRATVNEGIISGNMPDNSSPNVRTMPSQRFGPVLFHNAPYSGPSSIGINGLVDRNRSRRADNPGIQLDNKQYQLDLEKIIKGEDTRTTIMIKNIPNKYTSKMLLAAIDETHKGAYDFLYLPIDFKNKCNVGYAFINMVSPAHIISFYEGFNGKKWEKFNSEKVASLAYARIQGRAALVAHFQNSSLMNEDKRCRPILFDSEGAEAGDQELFPLSSTRVHQEDRTVNLLQSAQGISPNGNPEKSAFSATSSED
ncbi:unnamed protein product [Musa acuminata var. zebrina]